MVNLRVGTTGRLVVRNPSLLDTAGSLNHLATPESASQTANTFSPLTITSTSAVISRSSADTPSDLTTSTIPTIDPTGSDASGPAISASSIASVSQRSSPNKTTIAGITVAVIVSVLITLVMVYMVHRLYRKSRSRSCSPNLMDFSEKEGDRNSVSIESLPSSDSHASCDSDTCSEDEDSLLPPRTIPLTNSVLRQTSIYQALPSRSLGIDLSCDATTHHSSPRPGQQLLQHDTDFDRGSDQVYLSENSEGFQALHSIPAKGHSRAPPKPYRCPILSPIVDNFSNGPAPLRPGGPPSYSKSPYSQTLTSSDLSVTLPPYSSPRSRSPWTSTQSFKNESAHVQHDADWTSSQHFLGLTMPSQTSQGLRSFYDPPLSPPAPPPPFSPPAVPAAQLQGNYRKYHASQSQDSLLPQRHAHRARASTMSVVYNPVPTDVHLYSSDRSSDAIQPFQHNKPLLKLDMSDIVSDNEPRLARHRSMITHHSALTSPPGSIMSAPPIAEPQLKRHMSCLSPRATGLPLGFTMSSRTVVSDCRPISNAATTGSTLSPLSPLSPCLTDCTEFSEDSREHDSRNKPLSPIQQFQIEISCAAESMPDLNTSTEAFSRSSIHIDESQHITDSGTTDLFPDDGISVPFLFRLPINPRSSSLPRPPRTPKPKPKPKRTVLSFSTHSIEI